MKRINFSSDLREQREGIAFTYIGYDFDDDGLVKDDNCYFKYTQASNATTPPGYEQITTGC